MAVSLMLALLDIPDPDGAQNRRAARYRALNESQQRRVQEPLYEALYSILDALKIGYEHAGNARPASMAIGEALARIISNDLEERTPEQRDRAAMLQLILRPIAERAMDDIQAQAGGRPEPDC